MKAREFKNYIYGEFARLGKLLSSPKRVELLDLLTQGEKSVEVLAKETDMSVANASKHLQTLLDVNLVSYTKDKNYVYYRLESNEVRHLIMSVRTAAEDRIPDINDIREKYVLHNDELTSISLQEMNDRLTDQDAVLLDVRPADEYTHAHIPGAVSAPIDQLDEHIHTIPKEKLVICSCRGPYCTYATEAALKLSDQGYYVKVLEAGINEWKQSSQ